MEVALVVASVPVAASGVIGELSFDRWVVVRSLCKWRSGSWGWCGGDPGGRGCLM